jgi:hypothetical protein
MGYAPYMGKLKGEKVLLKQKCKKYGVKIPKCGVNLLRNG